MSEIFPPAITSFPEADIPIKGVHAFISQGPDHQILFMEFSEYVILPEHSHGAQWGVVLAGKIELVIGGVKHSFTKGQRFFIPAGIKHSARIHAGYADITFFDEKDRYRVKPTTTG
jgi:quercetin dioxygenase-like cupin family protein